MNYNVPVDLHKMIKTHYSKWSYIWNIPQEEIHKTRGKEGCNLISKQEFSNKRQQIWCKWCNLIMSYGAILFVNYFLRIEEIMILNINLHVDIWWTISTFRYIKSKLFEKYMFLNTNCMVIPVTEHALRLLWGELKFMFVTCNIGVMISFRTMKSIVTHRAF